MAGSASLFVSTDVAQFNTHTHTDTHTGPFYNFILRLQFGLVDVDWTSFIICSLLCHLISQ